MQKSFRLIALIVLVLVGVWAWRTFFPGPERVIRSRLTRLARAASFEPRDGAIPRALQAQQVPDFFTADAVVLLEPRGYSALQFTGRDEIRDAALVATRALQGLKIEFLDITVTVDPDGQTALGHLTGKATVSGERDFQVMELNFRFRNVDGKWLIFKVETVKTLSTGPASRPGRRPRFEAPSRRAPCPVV